MTTICYALVLVVALTSFAHSSDPALRARLTRSGADYLAATGKKLLVDLVEKYSKLPAFETESHGAKLKLKAGGRISNFNAPSLGLAPAPPNVVTVSTAGGHIQLDAKGSASYKLGFIPLGFDFDLRAKADNLKFAIAVKLEVTANGHLQLALVKCDANVGGLDLHFGGNFVASIVNLFHSLISDSLMGSLNGEVCNQLQGILKDTANAELMKLKQSFDLPEGFRLNYDFAAQPQITEQVVDVLFGGSVQYKEEPPVAVSASQLPTTDEHDKYVYIWAAAADIANALAKLGQEKGILKYKLDAESEPGAADFLQTGGNCFICVGGLLPGLRQKYPNTSVYVDLATSQAPVFSLVQDKAMLSLVGGMQMRSEQPPGELIINGELAVDGAVSVELKTDDPETIRLHGQFTLDRVKVLNFTSNIGPLTEKQLQRVIDFFSPWIAAAISYRLNTLALPQIPALQLLDPELKLLPGFIEIASSVNFTGTIPLPRFRK